MVGWPYLSELDEARENGRVRPEARLVEGEDTASLVGSEWLAAVYVVGVLGGQPPPPEGVELVDIGFRVTPRDDEAGELLGAYCRFRALDGEGRSWEPTLEYGDRGLSRDPGNTSGGCTDGSMRPVRGGTEQTFLVSYLVPEEVAEELRFEVSVTTTGDSTRQAPEALVFDIEPMDTTS
ncbi:hypothetical protein [Nocardiopsis alba]|uniref:hypothetical protein n=1 Tax=Nocardiopsis alba TaxID=53437 RepID=UPI00363FA0D0